MPSWTRINSVAFTSTVAGPVTTLAGVIPWTVVAGRLLVVKVAGYSATVTGVTDSAGNVYTPRLSKTTIPSLYLFGCVAATGGPGIVITLAGTGMFPSMVVGEYDPGGGLISFGSSVGAAGNSTAPASGSITLGAAANLVIGAVAVDHPAGTFSANAPFTLGSSAAYAGGKADGLASEYALNQGAGAVAASFGMTSAASWQCGVANWVSNPPGISAVSPTTVLAANGGPVTLTITGFQTNFQGNSAIGLQPLSGATSVTLGAWTALSATSGTLRVTVGPGIGTFAVTVDGNASPPIATAPQPMAINAWVSSHGLAVFQFTSPGVATLQALTAIGSDPAITVNGSPAAIGPATWPSTTKNAAVVAYRPATPILPADVVAYSLAAGGFVTALGSSLGVASLPVSNQVGAALEGPVGTFPGFNVPRTMRAGVNWGSQPAIPTNNRFPAKNLIKQASAGGFSWLPTTGTALNGYDANDYPTTWTPGGTLQTFIANSSLFDGVDNFGLPCLMGTYAVILDDPANDKTFTLIGSNGVTITGPVAGTAADGGKLLSWAVAYVANPSNTNPVLRINMKSAAGSYVAGGIDPNLWACDPGTTVYDRRLPLASSELALARLTSPGGRAVDCIRPMDAEEGYGGLGNYAVAADLPASSRATWNASRKVTASGTWRIRYINTDPAKGPAPAGDGTYSWATTAIYGPQAMFPLGPDGYDHYWPIAPANGGQFAYHSVGGNQSFWVLEIACDNPHGFVHGRVLSVTGTTRAGIGLSQGQTANANPAAVSGIQCWITGPNSLAFCLFFGGSTAPPSTFPLTIDPLAPGPFATDWVISQQSPYNNASTTYDYFSALCGQLGPSTARYVNLPYAITVAGIQRIAQMVAPGIAPGGTLILEHDNEGWNSGHVGPLEYWAMLPLFAALPAGTTLFGGRYMAGTSPIPANFNAVYALVAAAAMDVFTSTFSALRPDVTIRRMLSSQWNNPTATSNALAACVAYGLPRFDYLGLPVYVPGNMPNDAPYQAAYNPASGNWPVGQLNDLYRHYTASCTDSPTFMGGHRAAIATYCPWMQVISYECALQRPVPNGLNTSYYAGLAHDVMAHPSWYQVVQCYLLNMQTLGFVLANYFSAFGVPAGAGGDQWLLAGGMAQPPGLGLSNTFATSQGGSPADGKAHYSTNQAVGLQALLDWLDGTPIPPPTPTPTPTTPGVMVRLDPWDTRTTPVPAGWQP